MNDLKLALRRISKKPSFAFSVVLTLGIGIGAVTGLLSVLQGALWTLPPFENPERIVVISKRRLDGQTYRNGIAGYEWREWQTASGLFSEMAVYDWTFDFLRFPDGSEAVKGMRVTPAYFRLTGRQPVLGRSFLPADEDASVVLIGDGLWERHFGRDPDIIGRKISFARREPPLTIVGVMPEEIRFLPVASAIGEPNYDVNDWVDFWLPAPVGQPYPDDGHWSVAARLSQGRSAASVERDLMAVSERLVPERSELEGVRPDVRLLTDVLNEAGREFLLPILGAAILVFLIACLNASGLILARGLHRQKEFCVRMALGARRGTLLGEVLSEALVLAALAGGVGVILAWVAVRGIRAVGVGVIPRLDAVQLNWDVFLWGCGAALLAGFLASLVPMLWAFRLDPNSSLKASGASAVVGPMERQLLRGVVALQIALTIALMTGAGLLVETMRALAAVRPGYVTENILTMNVTDVRREQFFAFHEQALARFSGLPGVRSAAFVWGLPLTGNRWLTNARIEGRSNDGTLGDMVSLPTRAVTPGYFELMGQSIRSGRGFPNEVSRDTNRIVYPRVAVINEAMAERLFGAANPIGSKLILTDDERQPPVEVIGVVTNARTDSLDREPEPEIYFSLWEAIAFTKHLLVKTVAEPRQLIQVVEQELRAIEPTLAISDAKALSEIRNESVAIPEFVLQLLSGFSAIACSLAAVGLHGILTLSVNSRRLEIAIRMAIGARANQLAKLVLRDALLPVVIGLVLGWGGAIALGYILKGVLFGVTPMEPAVLLGISLLFLLVAVMAVVLPARRAVAIDSMGALRAESL